MDLIDKAKQLNISHFTVHDFVNEIERLRKIESAAVKTVDRFYKGYYGVVDELAAALKEELK